MPAATTEDAETPSEWSTFFGGQDIMKEFKTANNNMGDFTYMPGFSAVAAKMNETAAKAPMAPARLQTSSPTHRPPLWIR